MTIKQPGGQFILAVSKDCRGDDNFITRNPADGMTTCIDLRANVFDNNAPVTVRGLQ